MKLKVLADNNTFIDMYYLGEPAVSYYIEDGNDRILFDVGYSDVFMKNAKKMNIDHCNCIHEKSVKAYFYCSTQKVLCLKNLLRQ